MANRAYLFATDQPECWEHNTQVYYDSRHTIPVAWWLLFEPADVRLIERVRTGPMHPQMKSRKYHCLRLRTERLLAVERFARKRTLLDVLVKGRIDPRRVAYFQANLSNWSGKHLVMEADEILERPPEEEFALSLKGLQLLSAPSPDTDQFLGLWRSFSIIPTESDELDDQEVKVLGWTYGDLANRLWNEIVKEQPQE
jgi:hypothetical protein